jgi:putative ABC transport system ATP-binding protein
LIEITNVSKHYDMGETQVRALDDICLEIDKGDFLLINGPSGSGKSTLLYTIGGLLTPTMGKLSVNGIDIYKLNTRERARFRRENVGFIFQTFELLPYLTAQENVMVPLSLAGVDMQDQEEWALESLERVGLENRAGHKPTELSGGEMQRVAIARGIVNEPNILLADEPTGNLDQKTGAEIMNLLKGFNDGDGQTIVFVTHDQSKAIMANKFVGMTDGQIVTRKI